MLHGAGRETQANIEGSSHGMNSKMPDSTAREHVHEMSSYQQVDAL